VQAVEQRAVSNVSASLTHAKYIGEYGITRIAPHRAPVEDDMAFLKNEQQTMSEFPDLPSLESQLRQQTADFPLRIISTVWASNSGYHPGYRHLINRCGLRRWINVPLRSAY
jgi:hypothetical protein